MKKTFTLIVVFLFGIMMATAQNSPKVKGNLTEMELQFQSGILVINNIERDGQTFGLLQMEGYGSQHQIGRPALPTRSEWIEIALGEGVSVAVKEIECDTLEGETLGLTHPVVPAQPSRRKSDNSPRIFVQDSKIYQSDRLYGEEVVTVREVGIARNQNLALVTFNPVQWNPVSNQVVIVRSVTVTVKQKKADLTRTTAMQRTHASGGYHVAAKAINAAKDAYIYGPMRYTIIAHSSFRGKLNSFVNWKRQQGFIVDEKYTDDSEVGNTTNSIKNYLQIQYDNATAVMPAPTYVLFVGDVDQVPAYHLTYDGESHYSDLPYCCWTGNDYIPDAYYGRFSAQNESQLTPQILKSLMYERYQFPNSSYLNKAALIAGVDGGYEDDYAYQYCDPTMDYAAKEYVNSSHGFTTVTYYKNNTRFSPSGVTVTGSSQTSATATALRNLYNEGCGWVNYSAHGDVDEWHEPSFTTTHIAQMTNYNMPMVMIGNCCLSSSFQEDECFGEALLRKNGNAGAVGYIGASNYTYWEEDFFWSVGLRSNVTNTSNPTYSSTNLGMYDRLFHTHNESAAEQYLTLGAMIHAGNMSVERSNSDLKEYYWQVYHVLGDPSLLPWLGQPTEMSCNIPTNVNGLTLTMQVPPYAYVGITTADTTFAAATFADRNGNATVTFNSHPGVELHVQVTAQGYIPYEKTVHLSIEGSYPSITAINATQPLNAGSEASLALTLKNHGNQTATNIAIEIQTESNDMLLNRRGTVATIDALAAGEERLVSIDSIAHIWHQVKDQKNSRVKAIVRWGENSTEQSKTFTLNAPSLKVNSTQLNNRFDVDGTATLSLTINNEGHIGTGNIVGRLISLNPNIRVTDSTEIANIAEGGVATGNYTLEQCGYFPTDIPLVFIHTIQYGSRTFRDTLTVVLQQNNKEITFEEGSWGDVSWTQGQYPWEITTAEHYAGSYSARSRTWGNGNNNGNNKKSELTLVWTSSIDDSLTFYKKVSSEEDYDYYYFYIDGQQKEELSGTNGDWSRSAYAVTAGTHTFKWSYEKDESQRRGSDCAWIDNVRLPATGNGAIYTVDSICQGSEYTFGGQTINTDETGIYQFVDSTSISRIYQYLTLVVSAQPEVTISAEKTQIVYGEGVRLTVSGATHYVWNDGTTTPIMDAYPPNTRTYTVVGYNRGCGNSDSVTIEVEGGVGIDNVADKFELKIYPNPTSEYLYIEGEELNHLRVFNIMGQTIMDKSIEGGAQSVVIETQPWRKGTYIIQATKQNGQTATRKVIKK